MEAELEYTRSAQENAEAYFDKSKEAKKKLEGAEQAIKKLEQRVKELEKGKFIAKELKKKEEREWYENFYWFFTSNGMLAIGGRSAQQNEQVNAKYFDAKDVFFHANVFGASVVVLKNGEDASDEIKEEVAQFAASFSKAWEDGLSNVDVFSAKREQVSKSESTGHLATGSFLISGSRAWHRNVKLELYAFLSEKKKGPENKMNPPLQSVLANTGKFSVVPAITFRKATELKGVRLVQGKIKKSDAAKTLAKKLGYTDIDYIMQHLPPGEFSLE